jgi:hypothetical protein
VAMVSPWRRTILYNAGYCSHKGALSNQTSSQNRICAPFFIEKVPWRKKVFYSIIIMTKYTHFTFLPIVLLQHSLVRITPQWRYHANTLILSGIFIF